MFGVAGRTRIRIYRFRAPEPLSILNPSNFVPKNVFPVVKGLTKRLARVSLDPKNMSPRVRTTKHHTGWTFGSARAAVY